LASVRARDGSFSIAEDTLTHNERRSKVELIDHAAILIWAKSNGEPLYRDGPPGFSAKTRARNVQPGGSRRGAKVLMASVEKLPILVAISLLAT
jgi:hypothetical protein